MAPSTRLIAVCYPKSVVYAAQSGVRREFSQTNEEHRLTRSAHLIPKVQAHFAGRLKPWRDERRSVYAATRQVHKGVVSV